MADLPSGMLGKGRKPDQDFAADEQLYRAFEPDTPALSNYPHSEIRAYTGNGEHIKAKEHLDPDMHLRWRNRLRQTTRIVIRP